MLQYALDEFDDEKLFADALRVAMYRPVLPESGGRAPISLYELGVVYFPGEIGKYDVNTRKLEDALLHREDDIYALLVQDSGILPNICETLSQFLYEENQPIFHEFINAAMARFLNECRRLTAMWA